MNPGETMTATENINPRASIASSGVPAVLEVSEKDDEGICFVSSPLSNQRARKN